MRVRYSIFLFALLGFSSVHAQLIFPTGGNHPELHWNELETEHFRIIYHDGLDSVAMKAAPVAEEVYCVVTTNLKTPLTGKVKIYFSDYDEIKNAFAFEDDYIFIWMRGILDDLPYGLRSSGTSKWLRSVITHEFTHIVIDHATKDILQIFTPQPKVPRWFNEGLARFMEPDGWTSDLDAFLRVSTVTDHLDLGEAGEYLGGVMMYEGGQSLVRYIAVTYGDSALVKILKYNHGIFYSFPEAVQAATKKSLEQVIEDWHKTLNVYYNSNYGQKEEASEFARKIPINIAVVLAARIEPGGKRIAMIGNRTKASSARLYLVANDTCGDAVLLSDEAGIEPVLSWYPGKEAVCFSKYRIGSNGNLVHDLYRLDIDTKELTRLTNDGRYEEPDVALQGNRIVAVHTEENHSDLVLMDFDGAHPVPLTNYQDPNTQVYAPRWSADGKKITYSVFRANGQRDIAIIDVATKQNEFITNDSINDRSSMFSPDGKELVYLSHRNGVPNCFRTQAQAGSQLMQMTDIAGAIYPWDWSGSKDSILATSYDSRNTVGLYWIPAKREVKSAPTPPLKPKWTDWRLVHFPLITRPYDSLPSVAISGPGSYNSFAHITPVFITPILLSDKGNTGLLGLRYGFFGTATDPMEKHLINAFLDYGNVSKEFGGMFSYTNRQLYQTINLTVLHLRDFVKTLEGTAVYEREQGGAVTISQVLYTPNSITTSHILSVSGNMRKLEPTNLFEFDSARSFGQRPIAYKGIDLSLNYLFLSREFILGLDLTHADKKISSDLTYTRARLNFTYDLPFDEDREVTLGFRGAGVAQFGDQIPQEYVGFTTDEVFEHGFSPQHLQYNYRLRGIRRAYYGDRLALGSAELIFGQGLSFVGFFDIGSVWFDKTPTNYPAPVATTSLSQTQWLQSAGMELRIAGAGLASISGGVGWEIKDRPPPDWYFRITTYF
jgi:Tol biopolymer transport system component